MVRVAGRGWPGNSLPPRLLGFEAPGILRFFAEFRGSVRKDGNGDRPCPPTPGNQSRRFPQSAKPTGPPSVPLSVTLSTSESPLRSRGGEGVGKKRLSESWMRCRNRGCRAIPIAPADPRNSGKSLSWRERNPSSESRTLEGQGLPSSEATPRRRHNSRIYAFIDTPNPL